MPYGLPIAAIGAAGSASAGGAAAAAAGGGIGLGGAILGSAAIQGGAGILGAFGQKVRTPGFGMTNVDELQDQMKAIGLGPGGLVDILRGRSEGDLARLGDLRDFNKQTMLGGIKDLSRLKGFAGDNTQNILNTIMEATPGVLRSAYETRDRAVGAVSGAFSGLKQNVNRDLSDNILGAVRRAGVGGVKGGNRDTVQIIAAQQAAEAGQNQLANIAAMEGQAIAGIEERTGNTITGLGASRQGALEAAMMGRAGVEEGIHSNAIGNISALRNQFLGTDLQLLGLERNLATDPEREALNVLGGIPVFGGSAIPHQSRAQGFSEALAGIGQNILTGTQIYNSHIQAQQQQELYDPFIRKMLESLAGEP